MFAVFAFCWLECRGQASRINGKKRQSLHHPNRHQDGEIIHLHWIQRFWGEIGIVKDQGLGLESGNLLQLLHYALKNQKIHCRWETVFWKWALTCSDWRRQDGWSCAFVQKFWQRVATVNPDSRRSLNHYQERHIFEESKLIEWQNLFNLNNIYVKFKSKRVSVFACQEYWFIRAQNLFQPWPNPISHHTIIA